MSNQVKWVKRQKQLKRKKRDLFRQFNDPLWPQMWYLNRKLLYNMPDMNVTGAWSMGYSGKGVVVTFIDDGIERDHPDLIENYDPEASYDFNDNDDDPMPRYDIFNSNKLVTFKTKNILSNYLRFLVMEQDVLVKLLLMQIIAFVL